MPVILSFSEIVSGNVYLIGGLTPFVRPGVTPQSDLRGGDDARVGRGTSYQGQSKDPAAPQGGLQARGTGPEARSATATETPRPVAPPQGLLAIGMDGIEALQGIKPKAPDEKVDEKVDEKAEQKADEKVDARGEKIAAPGELSEEEADQVRELKARDQEVRRHEQAHAAAGGAYAGAPSYEYQQGPDGQRYAVGGEVSIDVSPVAGDPGATVQKMRQVKAAANAPAQPSGQDRSVAATADAVSQRAQAELLAQSTEKVADQTTEKTADKTGAPEEIKATEGGEKPGATSAPAAPTGAQAPALPDGKPEAKSDLAPQIRPDQKPASIGSTPEAPQFAAPGAAQAPSQANPPRDIRPGSFADISV